MIFKSWGIIRMALPTLNQLKESFNLPDSVIILTERQIIAKQQAINRAATQNQNFNIPQATPDQPLSYLSLLNTPVYSNIEFLPGTYETNTPGVFKSFGSTIEGDPDRLRFEAVLVTVSQQKVIVKTTIQGRNGTVKEYIGMDDFQVQVNGIITGANGVMPIKQIAGLNKMLIAPIPIEVACQFLQIFGIDYLVLDSYTLEEAEGAYAYQKFSLSFLSDVQQELELINI